MDKNKYTEECKDETFPHLPMGQLFYLLHSNGFNVKPDDYIEMLKITERFGSADIDATAKWICPVIATSEAEQARFYNIIEQYKKTVSLPACEKETVVTKPIPSSFKILLSLFIAGLLLLSLYLSLKKRIINPEEFNKERTVEKGEPLLLDASNLLKDRLQDSAQIQFTWQFNDGISQNGLRISHVYKDPGDYLVKRQFSSSNTTLLKKSDSLLVHVCNDLPKVTINIPAATVMAKQPVTITATVDADTGTVSYYQWTINDSVFSTPSPVVNNFIFSTEGDYPVECKAVVGNVNAPCTATDNAIIQVLSNEMHYSAHFSAARPGTYEGESRLTRWVTFALLLPAVAGLLFSFFKRKRKAAVVHEDKPLAATFNKGPYDIPFEQNDTKLVQPEIDLRRTFIQMHYKAEEETMALNINGTIHSIIQSGGSPQLVFAPLKQEQLYLILIDRANPKSMLTHFFGYLAKSMAEDGIPVVIFYYDKNFFCYNDQYPAGLTLQRLADTWQNATLIILGKAHELVYNIYPVIEEKYFRELNRWQSKAIITPLPLKDWGVKEKILQGYIILVPADVTTLQKLIPALREKIKLNKALLQIIEPEQYSILDTDFQDVNELQDYLGKDEVLFQWLCAICIYPRLKWEVLVETGKAILDKYGQPESLDYSNLLKLCRISWMQQGVFPQATRLELLKLLKTDNEICARERLLHMLNYSTAMYGESGRFFEEEKKRQVLTNQFVLHASNNNYYNQYAGSKETFKKLWQNDAILDVPVKKYLDKKENDNWQTPISDGRNSVGLSAYFNLPEITLNKTLQLKRILVAAASVLLIIFWIYIVYGGGAEKLEPFITLNKLQKPESVPVAIKLIKNFRHCGDSLKKNFDQMDGYLEINNQKFPLAYNQNTSSASFSIPYKSFITGIGQLMFVWDINKSVVTKLNFKNKHLPDSVTIACIDPDKITKQRLYIRYNDTAGYRSIETTLGDALYGYTTSALPADFTDSSRIVYYETNQKARADSIVDIIKQTFNINVKEEFIEESDTPPATPILFLNTMGTGKATIGGNEENADYYHGIGDNLFMEKKYQQSIEQYARAIKLNPKDALAWYQTGICYEMMVPPDLQEAITSYNAAIMVKTNDPAYYYRRGSVKYELKRYAVAIPDFDRVIAMNAPNTKAQYLSSLYFRGKSKFFLKNLDGACADFKKAADAGYAPAKKDYGVYCSVANNPVKPATDYNQYNTDKSNADVKQQTAISKIPLITAAQLSDMLLEVSTGKKSATDFLTYLRGNDIAVKFNGNTMSFTDMCKELQRLKGISKLVAEPTINENNQITAMTVTTTGGYSNSSKKQ
jgi:tetratricopeptide (TPR) repeat protein